MESKYIDNIIQNAVNYAKDKNHEYVTLEHIMFCLLEHEDITGLIKELKVGLILGVLYGVLLGIFANLKFIGTDPMLGLVVGLSIASSMLIAVAVGSFTPLILRKLEIDPAVAAGPFVTTSIDILGVLLYFIIAGILLKI